MKKYIAAALLVIAPMAAMAESAPESTMIEVADTSLSTVSGQAGLGIDPAQIIASLQQGNALTALIRPTLPNPAKQITDLIKQIKALYYTPMPVIASPLAK
jgi:ABC-type transporter MlaC component